MPIKLGKSKSSTGSELMHSNSCTDETAPQTKKNRGFRQLLFRSKCASKIPTGRSSVTDESAVITKINRSHGKTLENINVLRTESSPVNMQALTCHSVSPKLYTNSCASSIEELSKVAATSITTPALTSSVAPCSPIQDVILEEDYEEALLLNNRTQAPIKADSDLIIKDNLQHNSAKKTSQGIYNEPNDSAQGSNKEIIETCRICQITPTNQFKEIRSRSGSDTDSLLVHPDHGVGGRCSTNSSSVGSALTLSESPAVISSSYSPQIASDIQPSPNNSVIPKVITTSITALSINVHTNVQSSSGPPTVYNNSPKGNTIICHHPSSPFAPPPPTKPTSSSNPPTAIPTVANSSPCTSPMFCESQDYKYPEVNRASSSGSNITSRRPGRFGKPSQVESTHSSGKQSTDGNTSLSDVPPPPKHSERRSEYYRKQPVYEEAWDLKLKRMCLDMGERSSQSSVEKPIENISTMSSVPPVHPINVIPYNRPQSAAGARRRTDSPSSKYSSPPAVPPHRRRSVHIKMTHCNSFEDNKGFSDYCQSSQSISDCRTTTLLNEDSLGKTKSHLKHNINPSFDDQGITTDYDYAYNETWSLGVKRNMAINLSSNPTEIPNTQRKDSGVLASGYMDKIDSVDSEESSSLSTSQEATHQTKESNISEVAVATNMDDFAGNVDNDSLSNDSYEEPWDVRHGRVISELTSARLIDPACVLSAHEQTPSKNMAPVTNNSRNNHCHSQRIHDKTSHNSSSHNSSRQRSISSQRKTCNSSGITSSSLINKTISLDDQPWYHEACSRSQAEQLLLGAVEGSFLVRKSETSRNDFSLTIRHNNDYLHMKISRNSKGFILGQYSQPYVTIPHMLHHYSLTMVPVRGADAVILKNPIVR